MKKITHVQSMIPMETGRIRVTIRYRAGEKVTYEGIFNPDRNLNQIRKVLSKRAPKPLQQEAPKDHVSMTPREVEDSVAGAAESFVGGNQ